ncbi:MAG: ATP-binding protein [Verrucomicrobiota bacterium]
MLISTLVSGVVIIGVCLVAWSFLVRSAREAVDIQLEAVSGRLIRDMHPRLNWNRMVNRIKISHGDEIENSNLILHLRDDINDSVIYTSLDNSEDFFSRFPEGFPSQPAEPRPRPEYAMEAPPFPPGEFADLEGPGAPDRERGPGPGFAPPDGKERPKGPGKGKGPPGGEEGLSGLGPMDQQYATVAAYGKEWRVVINHERGYFVLAALDLTEAIADLRKLEKAFLIGIPVGIALIGFGGLFVVDRAMRPVREISEAAENITARDLSARIEGTRNSDPEFEHLVDVLNGMMERLEIGFSHANRFSADVSHELKTPITVMQGEIESALRQCEGGTGEEQRLLLLREETNRLKSITRSLMLLSQADVGELIRKSESIFLSEELTELVEDAEVLTGESEVEIQAEIEEGVVVSGDVTLVRQSMLNLINNAIKYNEPGGFVSLSLESDEKAAVIRVENSGAGIPQEARAKIFDRFYRADESRSRNVDGYGLGLSLTQAIIEGHGGTIELADEGEEKTTQFVIRLPLESGK